MNHTGAVKEYLSKLKRRSALPHNYLKSLAEGMEKQIGQYLYENPNASMEQLVQVFGKPEDVTAEYAGSLDQEQLARYAKRRNIMIGAVLAIAILSILALSMWVCRLYAVRPNYIVETIRQYKTIIY